jgi:hypothetical protein
MFLSQMPKATTMISGKVALILKMKLLIAVETFMVTERLPFMKDTLTGKISVRIIDVL